MSIKAASAPREKGAPLLRDQESPHRRLQRRQMARDRARHRHHVEAWRGARPDRRIGCRQVDHRSRRHGLRQAGLPHQRRFGEFRRHRPPRGKREPAPRAQGIAHRLCRPECRRLVQPGPPHHRADHRDPARPQSRSARQGRAGRRRSLPSSQLPNPKRSAAAIRIRCRAASCSTP